MPAPSTLHFYAGSGFARPGLYPDLDAYFAELAAIYRAEIADIVRAGGRYIQLDEVALAMLCDPMVRELVRSDGLDPTRLIALYVESAPSRRPWSRSTCCGGVSTRRPVTSISIASESARSAVSPARWRETR